MKRLYREQLVHTIARQQYVIPPITLEDAEEIWVARVRARCIDLEIGYSISQRGEAGHR
jgi:hypothetical protein